MSDPDIYNIFRRIISLATLKPRQLSPMRASILWVALHIRLGETCSTESETARQIPIPRLMPHLATSHLDVYSPNSRSWCSQHPPTFNPSDVV